VTSAIPVEQSSTWDPVGMAGANPAKMEGMVMAGLPAIAKDAQKGVPGCGSYTEMCVFGGLSLEFLPWPPHIGAAARKHGRHERPSSFGAGRWEIGNFGLCSP